MKVEVAVLGSPSLNSTYVLCGRKATLNLKIINGGSFILLPLQVDTPRLIN